MPGDLIEFPTMGLLPAGGSQQLPNSLMTFFFAKLCKLLDSTWLKMLFNNNAITKCVFIIGQAQYDIHSKNMVSVEID